MPKPDLGPLEQTYTIAPVFFQRAAFIAVLSFLFFLAMMFAFYILGNILYFLLATAFLLIYLVTMVGLVLQKRSAVRLYEGGIEYKKFSARWEDIKRLDVRSLGSGKLAIEITADGSKPVTLPETLQNADGLARRIRTRLPG